MVKHFFFVFTAACRTLVHSMSRELDILMNMVSDNPRHNTDKPSKVLPDFPITSFEDLTDFNDLLKNKEEARIKYVSTFNILVVFLRFMVGFLKIKFSFSKLRLF